jgi:hypothetical protein
MRLRRHTPRDPLPHSCQSSENELSVSPRLLTVAIVKQTIRRQENRYNTDGLVKSDFSCDNYNSRGIS